MDDLPPAQQTPPEPGAASRRPSRRSVLTGGAVVVLAAAGGTAAGFLPEHRRTPPSPNPAPQLLIAAAERERALIADLDATTGGTPALREVLVRARADHAAHLAGFERLLDRYDPTPAQSGAPRPTHSAVPVPGVPRTADQLRAAEKRAATLSAHAASASSGRVAVLLASVSASESTHAALIT